LYYVIAVHRRRVAARAAQSRAPSSRLDDALRITCEVADALDHSAPARHHPPGHQAENILLEDGQALVADFGIARAVSAVGEGKLTSDRRLTWNADVHESEQGMADPNLDGRTDIYSLGCVLYEMLAGSRHLRDARTQALIARHSLDQVPSLTIVRQTIPEEVEDAVLTALARCRLTIQHRGGVCGRSEGVSAHGRQNRASNRARTGTRKQAKETGGA